MIKKPWAVLILVVLISSAFFLITSDGRVGSAEKDLDAGAGPDPSHRGPDWTVADQKQFTTMLNPQNDLTISRNGTTGKLGSTTPFEVYPTLNVTAQRAVDRCPQWLNLSLTWRFAELTPAWQVIFGELLLNSSLNTSYLDEIGYTLSYTPKEILTHSLFDPYCLVENVDVMYNISRELRYADIIDTQRTDGEHSTVRYRMPGGNLTLPEDIYYAYIATPMSSSEVPAYVNFTLVEATDNPALYYGDHTDGVWWRTWLYNTSHHPSYPVLRDMLLNETYLWKGGVNNLTDNGAVGAVCRWQPAVMPNFGVNGNRSKQPVVHYIHHWGMCGENSDLLNAAGRIALIPTVPTLNLEGWHGWNEFYESGWHMWEAYCGMIDYPQGEGGCAAVPSLLTDGSQRDSTSVYSTTANLTVNVRDSGGLPVDGALVNLGSANVYNNPWNIGLIGNATDAKGNTTFDIRPGSNIYIHVYSSQGDYPAGAGNLALVVTNPQEGCSYLVNVTLPGSIASHPFAPLYSADQEFGTRYNVSVVDMIQPTRMHNDPFGNGLSVWKEWSNGSSMMVLLLDDANLANYQNDLPFNPARVLHIPEGGWVRTSVPSENVYHIVVTGRYQPMSRSKVTFNVTLELFTGIPQAVILAPGPGTYILETPINFSSKLTPTMPAMGPFTYQWSSNISGVISDVQTFILAPALGWHNITMTVSNSSGPISSDRVHLRVMHPNRAPHANVSLPADGSEYEYGMSIPFSANGSRDPDRDNLSYSWYIPSLDFEISTSREFEYLLVEGEYLMILTVSDPKGLNDTALVNFTVLPENKPPMPNIDSPKAHDVFYNDTAVFLSAKDTWDEEPLKLDYTWNSSIDGVVQKGEDGYVYLSPGNQTITLWADDGKHNRSTSVAVKVVAHVIVADLPPVAVMASPKDGDVYHINQFIDFNPAGSFDPENKNLSYRWKLDGMVESEQGQFLKMLPEGTYKVILEVSDGSYRVPSEEVTITVIDRAPVISIKFEGLELNGSETFSLSENDTLYLNATGSYDPEGTELFFLWYVNNDPVSAFPYMGSNLDPGSYAVRLEVEDGTGKTSSKTIWLTVLPVNETAEPPVDDDIVDDDVQEPDTDERGSLSFWIVMILVVLVFLALLGALVFMKMRTAPDEDDVEFEDDDEDNAVDWEE